ILPSTIIMIGLAIAYKHVHNFAGSAQFFHGLNGAVVALILVTAWRMGKNILTRRWQWALAVLAFLAVAVLDATVLEVILAAGLIGIYFDAFGEKQLSRLRNLGNIVARRRTRIRTRLAKQRRTPRYEMTRAPEAVEEEEEGITTFRSVALFAAG